LTKPIDKNTSAASFTLDEGELNLLLISPQLNA